MVSNLLSAERTHLDPTDKTIDSSGWAEDAHYTEPVLSPQWAIAYKMFTDDKGEYGLPYPIPVGEWAGGSVLSRMKRRDGGAAWSATKPARIGADATIECISERCGDAHLGGKRKMLTSLDRLVKHVRAFHPDEYETYKKYLDQIEDDIALQNPRLVRLMKMAKGDIEELPDELVAALDAEPDDAPVPVIVTTKYDCADCDWVPKANAKNPAIALNAHRNHKHKEVPVVANIS